MVTIDALLGIYIWNEHNLNNLLYFSIVHIIFFGIDRQIFLMIFTLQLTYVVLGLLILCNQ